MKRLAFIKDGVVLLVLNCDPKLFDALTGDNLIVDATSADNSVTFNWTYDGANFIAPVTAAG
jgi:hypothetical protein